MRKLLFGLLAISLILATGCGKQVPVTVSNNLEIWDISDVYIYQDSDKGPNVLTESIAIGESKELTMAPGTWNILIIDDEDGEYLFENVEISEAYTLKITPADRDSFEETVEIEDGVYYTGEGDALVSITNDLDDWTIYWVYVSEEGEGFWEDRLETFFLYPHETINVLVDPGVYDIQIEDEDGDTYTLYSIEVDEDGYEWEVTLDYLDEYGEYGAATGDGDCPVDIYNGLEDWTIWYVYVDYSSDPWGDDRLGAELLEPGETFTVWVDAGEYDIKCEDEDGDTYTLWNQNIDEDGYYWEVTLSDMD